MWIQRHISEVIERAFAQFPALVLSGARQAGKTSLVRHLFPQADERRHLKGFHVFEEVYGPAALYRGAVVCRTDQPYPLTEHGRIAALPLGGTQGLCQWIAEQTVV